MFLLRLCNATLVQLSVSEAFNTYDDDDDNG